MHADLASLLLVAVAIGFAVSMGAHYTGACMGMPHALRAVSARQALLIMAPLTFIGALLASHGVAHTVGHGLVHDHLTVVGQIIIVGVAFALTTVFNVAKVPTSTIQILVFTVAGVALAAHARVEWATIGTLAIIWVVAPPLAALLGFAFTRLLDRYGRRTTGPAPRLPASAGLGLGIALTTVGAVASFAMGANDVANATGSLVGTGTLTPLVAGGVGGLGLAVGVLTWGRPLLRRVAFDIVAVDRSMATAAQLVQAAVVLVAVSFGYFTSMNQALVGAMAGAGLARGRNAVHRKSLLGILRGWVIGPGAGLAAGYLIALAIGAAGAALS
ncbi:inorganic phosphate transporter [Curtobacterium ammoniigenes]|uniref:inorganic phosphate transporter n=1 Tax=Curtobacterium ammoniigenes TaxID=395387 RepID=UPI000830A7E4|nr:inorganic phosphate transporter [Curtobacterium ammoniigenes]